MTLLKDLVWHSALRRGAGEVDVGGSGGSSFEHLVEDAVSHIVGVDSTWGLVVTDDPAAWFLDTSIGPATEIDPGYLYLYSEESTEENVYMYVVGENIARLTGKADGSLHWSDGTNPPDVHAMRSGAESLFLGNPTDQSYGIQLYAPVDEAPYVYLFGDFGLSGAQLDAREGHGFLVVDRANGTVVFDVDVDGDVTINGAKITTA